MTGVVLFYLAGALTLGGAVGVVGTKNVVHAALFLLASLMGVAGVYLVIFAEFLALVQILVYGGAITIVVLFALMLTRLREFDGLTENSQWPLGILAGLAFFLAIGAAITVTGAGHVTSGQKGPSIQELGRSLFTQWAVPFEVLSLILLIALIGAVVITRSGEKSD